MKKHLLLKPLLIGMDILILIGAFQLSYWLRFNIPFLPDRPVPAFDLYFQFSFLVGLIGFLMLFSSGLYRMMRMRFDIEDFFLILRAVTLSLLFLMAMSFILRGYIVYEMSTYSRLIILLSWFLSLIGLTLWRGMVSLVLTQFLKRGRGVKNVIIVGTGQIAQNLYKALMTNKGIEYRPMGYVCDCSKVQQEVDGIEVMGGLEDLPKILRLKKVSEVILAGIEIEMEDVARLIKACERADVQFGMIPGFFEILTRQMTVNEVADIPIFKLEERIFQRWGKWVKRGLDIGVSMCVLIVFSPIWLLVAISVKLNSRGPVIFNHERVGKGEKVFNMFKFRSMYQDAEEQQKELKRRKDCDGAITERHKDVRVTRIGHKLRRYSIDEIPQLINVLQGTMSLVGPRPHMPSEVASYKEWHKRKFDVLPGMTGLTQVRGRKDLSLDEMVRLDIYYIENWSPLLDLQILLKTVPAVLGGKGAY